MTTPKAENEKQGDDIATFFYAPQMEEPIIRLSKRGFFYKGERIDDIHNVYERFNEWMTLAEKK